LAEEAEAMTERPKCRRCRGPLDLALDLETGRQEWTCNSPKSLATDAEFRMKWNSLPADEAARLTKEIEEQFP
jgi:hypothetical protein